MYEQLCLAELLRPGGQAVSNSARGRAVGKGAPKFQDQSATEKAVGCRPCSPGALAPRYPMAGRTSWTEQNYERVKAVRPLVESVSELFRSTLPDQFAVLERQAKAIHSYYRCLGKTPFTTMAINVGVRTAPHTDGRNAGFSALLVVAPSDFEGGEVIFPRYATAVRVRRGDVLIFDGREVHCNAAFSRERGAERLSLVLYVNKRLANSLSPTTERVLSGKPITDWELSSF